MMNKLKLSKPNDQGFQFGINESLTKYAHEQQQQWGGSSLPKVDITVLEVWKEDERVAYLLVDEKTNKPVKEASEFEAAACALDAFKVLKQIK